MMCTHDSSQPLAVSTETERPRLKAQDSPKRSATFGLRKCDARPLLSAYAEKWLPIEAKSAPPVPGRIHGILSLSQAVLSISVLAWLDLGVRHGPAYGFLVASFGASAVLVHSAVSSPLAQPRNVILGHGVSALAGVIVFKAVGNVPYFSCGLAVGLAILFMERVNAVHPPGGATALVAIIGGPRIHDMGFLYIVCPCMTGAAIMVLIGLICNNLCPGRKYPLYYTAKWPLQEFMIEHVLRLIEYLRHRIPRRQPQIARKAPISPDAHVVQREEEDDGSLAFTITPSCTDSSTHSKVGIGPDPPHAQDPSLDCSTHSSVTVRR